LPGQLPPAAIPQSAYGGPGNPTYAAAMAQAQAAALAGAGRAGPSGRAPIPGIPGMPPNMVGLQGVRGGPGMPSFPQNAGRGGMQMRPGQMSGFPQGNRNVPQVNQQGGQGGARDEAATIGGTGLTHGQLSAAPPQSQKQMLGEALFPKIQV